MKTLLHTVLFIIILALILPAFSVGTELVSLAEEIRVKRLNSTETSSSQEFTTLLLVENFLMRHAANERTKDLYAQAMLRGFKEEHPQEAILQFMQAGIISPERIEHLFLKFATFEKIESDQPEIIITIALLMQKSFAEAKSVIKLEKNEAEWEKTKEIADKELIKIALISSALKPFWEKVPDEYKKGNETEKILKNFSKNFKNSLEAVIDIVYKEMLIITLQEKISTSKQESITRKKAKEKAHKKELEEFIKNIPKDLERALEEDRVMKEKNKSKTTSSQDGFTKRVLRELEAALRQERTMQEKKEKKK